GVRATLAARSDVLRRSGDSPPPNPPPAPPARHPSLRHAARKGPPRPPRRGPAVQRTVRVSHRARPHDGERARRGEVDLVSRLARTRPCLASVAIDRPRGDRARGARGGRGLLSRMGRRSRLPVRPPLGRSAYV